jgi:cell division protein FtsB
MVIRTRLRAIVIPLVLYAVSGTATSYFVWHALHGERGLKTKDEYRARSGALFTELVALQTERRGWQHRVDMLRAESVDKDLLEEEARVVLDRVHKNDLVIFLPQPGAR